MVVAGLLIWSFSPVVGFAFVDWDDRHFIVESLYTRQPFASGLRTFLTTPWYGYPIPLVSLSWSVDARLSDGAPWSFHLTNLLLHMGNAALVFGLAGGWLSRTVRVAPDQASARLQAAVVAAGLWALHPVVAEPVSWCIGRKDLLCAMATLLSVLGSRLAFDRPGQGWRWLRWLGFAAALGSKPQAVIVPLLWLLDARVRSEKVPRPLLLEAGAGLALSLAFAVGSFALLGAAGGLSSTSTWERVLFALRHLALQAGNYLVPISLAPRYLMEVTGWPALVAAVAGAALWLAPVLTVWRGGWRQAGAGLVWAAVCFLPVAGLVGLNRGASDSYAYLPSIGIWLALMPLLERAVRRASLRLGLLVLLLTMAVASRSQSANWRNSESLWRRQVAVAPESASAWWSLADVYAASGRPREAVAVYELALKVVAAPSTVAPYLAMSRGCLLAADAVCAVHWLEVAEQAFPGQMDVAVRRMGHRALAGVTLAEADGNGLVRDWLSARTGATAGDDYLLVDDDAAALAALRLSAADENLDAGSQAGARLLLDYGRQRLAGGSGVAETPLPL